jgi:hypothetical protein
MDYHNVAQGKITIPNVDDGEECTLTDVRFLFSIIGIKLAIFFEIFVFETFSTGLVTH